jgi:hypothetical protein
MEPYVSISVNMNPLEKSDIYPYIGRVKLQNHHIKIIDFRGGRFSGRMAGSFVNI